MDKGRLRRELESNRVELTAKTVVFLDLQLQPPTLAKIGRLRRMTDTLECIDQDFTAETEFYFLLLSEIVFQRLLLSRTISRDEHKGLNGYLNLIRTHGESIYRKYGDAENKVVCHLLCSLYELVKNNQVCALEELQSVADIYKHCRNTRYLECFHRLLECLQQNKTTLAWKQFEELIKKLQTDALQFIQRIIQGGQKLAKEIIEELTDEAVEPGNTPADESGGHAGATTMSEVETCMARGAFFYDVGKYQQAIENYTRAVTLEPDRSMGYYERALAHARLGEDEEAEADFTKAIDLDPAHAEYYTNRGLYWQERGQDEAACRDFDRAIALDVHDHRAYMSRGILRSSAGDHTGAVDDYTRALALKADYAQCYFNRAITWSDLNQEQKAIEDLTRALTCDPAYVRAYLVRAGYFLKQGQRQQARADFEEARRLAPEDPNVREVEELFASLKHSAPLKIQWRYVWLLFSIVGLLFLAAYAWVTWVAPLAY